MSLNEGISKRLDYLLNKDFKVGSVYYIGEDEDGVFFIDMYDIEKLRTDISLAFVVDLNDNFVHTENISDFNRLRCISTAPLIFKVCKV